MKKILFWCIALFIIFLVCFVIYNGMTKENKNQENNKTQNQEVVSSGEFLNNEDEKENSTEKVEALYTEESYPRIDGSTATIPLSEAFKAEFLGKDRKEVSVKHNTTHYAYENLINGNADLILVTEPSDEEIEMAKQKGVELEVIPVVNEAFVFYTNVENPVKSLTVEQVQKIYTGEITNWKQVGGEDLVIKAYQREPNSGSQTGMEKLVMKGLKLMEAPKEDIVEGMAAIIGLVSDYENGKSSLGYSYYYYATKMYDVIDSQNEGKFDSNAVDRIQLLAINGVKPNNETIKNGAYPFRTNYYIVINKAETVNSPVRKLVEAMLSERGQKAAEAVGYVGIK